MKSMVKNYKKPCIFQIFLLETTLTKMPNQVSIE